MHPLNGLSKRSIIVVLLTAFGFCILYSPSKHSRKKNPRSTSMDSKTFIVVVSPLEYIWKQQVANTKGAKLNMMLPQSGNQPSLKKKFRYDIVYGSTEQWII